MALKKISSLIQGNKTDSCTPSGKISSHFPWDFGRLSMRKIYPLTFQAEKMHCLQPKNFSSHFSWQFKRQLSGKIFIPSLVQREKSYSCTPEIFDCLQKINLSLYLYKGKIGHLYAQAKQKRPTHPRTTKRGVQSASRLVRIVHVCISL